ncbi:TetR/AcrR family transcriptional regulator [Streptomyces iconiensis]|uniref:Helix-turn-helix domain-containing protein n=1 Tax=Streptomyces iconiensis TaxID=1384038 RepID=A0ABT7A362_9ACTN|nr:TetR/AcrR family transcriptional regulator [Streptomyces iconiensis]MDJ1135507.1 helix-turn-helix domain-containing protein [Streptomyces iconiensis]
MSAPVDPAQQRRVILRGTAAALRERGTGAGMADIARAAGVGRATLYRHFATREALLEELSQFSADECVRAVRDAVRAGGELRATVLRATRALLAVGREYWTLVSTGPAEGPSTRELAVAGPLVELAARGQREGAFRTDLTAERLGAMHGVLIQGALLYPQLIGASLEEAAESVTRLYLDGAATVSAEQR